MENKEIREKLLCILRNNIQDFKRNSTQEYVTYNFTFKDILMYQNIVGKKIIVDIPPKYFWQKTKQKERYTLDYSTFKVVYGEFTIQLTKEESEEIMKTRQEKIEQRQLEELTKLCKGE